MNSDLGGGGSRRMWHDVTSERVDDCLTSRRSHLSSPVTVEAIFCWFHLKRVPTSCPSLQSVCSSNGLLPVSLAQTAEEAASTSFDLGVSILWLRQWSLLVLGEVLCFFCCSELALAVVPR